VADKKKTILLAEDEPSLRIPLKKKLTNSGYDVLEACNGEECLKIAFEKHPSLIVLDLIMPVKGGIEVLNELLNDEWGCNVPVIVLTNKSDFGTERRTFQYGAEEYLIKADHSLEDILKRVNARIS